MAATSPKSDHEHHLDAPIYSAGAALTESELLSQVFDQFKREDYRPPALPDVALEVLRLTGEGTANAAEIAGLLSQDPVLAADAFKIASSPAYSGRYKARSLQDMITRLGHDGLRNLVLELSMNMRVFKCPPYNDVLERLRAHSVCVARLSKIIAERVGLDGEAAYLAGLMHDLGVMASVVALHEGVNGARSLSLNNAWAAIEAIHGDVGVLVARSWGLPEEAIWVIQHHHDVLSDVNLSQSNPTGLVAYLADMWVIPMQFGALTSEQWAQRGPYAKHQTKHNMLQAMQILGMTQRDIINIRDQAQAQITDSP